MNGIKLSMIPAEEYSAYRYNAIFKAYKWDPQVNDHNTVSKHVVLMNRDTAAQLSSMAKELADETILMEEALIGRQALAKELGLPKRIIKALPRLENYDRKRHVRLMRFDFHPTDEGWAVSEVNSDVPGGLAEAVVLPDLAGEYFGDYERLGHVADDLAQNFKAKIRDGDTVAFVHATSYSDDRQVMQFLSDYFNSQGIKTLFAAPDHLRFKNGGAFSSISGFEGEIGAIVRFFPLEWLLNLPKSADWKGYYNCATPSCNHPVSVFAQSKRLPLIWDALGVEISAWKS
ncbi:MAG: glutathionylspermidine synthase family protein, partial [Firmicutes bacterium]|nr:glutathionylspermidine synthase family protein [Bacillota bacterium]